MADELLPEERRLTALRKLIQAQAASSKENAKLLGQVREQIEVEKQLEQLKNASTEQEKELLKLYQDRKKELDETLKGEEEKVQKTRKLLEEEDKVEKALAQQNKQRAKAVKILNTIKQISSSIVGMDFTDFASLTGLTTKFAEFAHKLDGARVGLAQTTGFTDALNTDMELLAATNNNLGIGIEESAKLLGAVSQEMTLFNALSRQGRAEVSQFTAEMSKLGVDAAGTGQALDALTRGMGFSSSAAVQAGKDFDRLAQQVGVPTGQVVKDFNTLSPQLARFGKNGTRVFKELTKTARSLGMSVKEAFDIAETFDTFESAADLAGKLNAQVGLQLNSVELMNASHEDRIKILQEEFRMRGRNFDDMSRREKQAIAEVLGVDEDMASRLFGNPVELRKYQKEQKEMAERANLMTTAMDKFRVSVEDLFLKIQPTFNYIIGALRWMADSGILQVLLSMAAAWGLITAVTKAYQAVMVPLTAIQGLFNTAVQQEIAQAPADVAAKQAMGAAASASASQIAAMGFAVLMVGGGVALAALGVAHLAATLGELGASAILVVPAVIGLGFGFNAMTVSLLGLGTVAAGVSWAILAVGAAVLMMGAGVGIAAVGIGMMAEGFAQLVSSFKELTPAQIGTMALAFVGLSTSLYALVGAMAAFAFPMTLIGLAAFGGMVYGLTEMLKSMEAAKGGLDSLEKIVTVTTQMNSGGIENMTKVIDQVVRVTGDASAARSSLLSRAVGALEELASTTSGASSQNRQGRKIVLKIENDVFAKGVVDIMTDELLPTVFK
jgi:hypothetical protein